MSPLRWLIAIAYITLASASYIYWIEIGPFFEFFIGNSIRFIKATIGFLIAILTLKLGVVITALFAALTITLKVFIGIIITALLPGTLKAILLPFIFDLFSYLHKKSEKLQQFVSWLLDWSKGQYVSIKGWWMAQHIADKMLLATLAILTVPILGLVFFYKRFILPYLITKLGENFVQRTVKYLWIILRKSFFMDKVFNLGRRCLVLAKRYLRRQNRRLTKLRQNLKANSAIGIP